MTILSKIRNDLDNARKHRDGNHAKIDLLTTLYSEAAMVGKNKGNRETTDDEVVAVAKKFEAGMLENRRILEAKLASAGTPDLRVSIAKKLGEIANELNLIQPYLPKMLSDDELKAAIKELIDGGSDQFGKLMTALKTWYPNQYDGAKAAKMVKETLGI